MHISFRLALSDCMDALAKICLLILIVYKSYDIKSLTFMFRYLVYVEHMYTHEHVIDGLIPQKWYDCEAVNKVSRHDIPRCGLRLLMSTDINAGYSEVIVLFYRN